MFCVDINGVYRHRLIGASRDVVVKERKAVIRIERSLETFDVPDCLPPMHTATPAVSGCIRLYQAGCIRLLLD